MVQNRLNKRGHRTIITTYVRRARITCTNSSHDSTAPLVFLVPKTMARLHVSVTSADNNLSSSFFGHSLTRIDPRHPLVPHRAQALPTPFLARRGLGK